MPVPKRKTSKSRNALRRSTKFIEPKAIAVCQTCQAPLLPHAACSGCGYYKGAKVLRTKADRMHERASTRRALQEQREAAQTK